MEPLEKRDIVNSFWLKSALSRISWRKPSCPSGPVADLPGNRHKALRRTCLGQEGPSAITKEDAKDGFHLWDALDFTLADTTEMDPAPECLEDSFTYDGWGYPVGKCAEAPGDGPGSDLTTEVSGYANPGQHLAPHPGRWISHDPLGHGLAPDNLYR
jgi:hypothetical protein